MELPPISGSSPGSPGPPNPPKADDVLAQALLKTEKAKPIPLRDRLTPLSSIQERKEALEDHVKMDANDFFLLKQQQKIWDATPTKPANFYRGDNSPLKEEEPIPDTLLSRISRTFSSVLQRFTSTLKTSSPEQWLSKLDFAYAKSRKWVEPSEKDKEDLAEWENKAQADWEIRVAKWKKSWDSVELSLQDSWDSPKKKVAIEIKKLWPVILERGEEFVFCDDELPELVKSCDTGWEDKIGEVKKRLFPLPIPPDYKEYAKITSLKFRRVLCDVNLQVLLTHGNTLDVHTRKAILSLANTPYQLRYDPKKFSGEEHNEEILRSDFESNYQQVLKNAYTEENLLEELKSSFHAIPGGISQKKRFFAPLFEDYKEALRQNEDLYLVPGDKTRKQLAEEAKTLLAKSLPDKEFVKELNKLFRKFREENLAPPFVKRPPPLEEISQKLQKFLPSKERLTLKPNDPEALREAFARLFTEREKKKIHVTELLKDLSSQNLQELQKLFPSVLDFSAPKALEKAAQELFEQYDQDKAEASKLLEQIRPEALLELEKEYTNSLKKNLKTFIEGDLDRALQRNKEFLEARVLDKSGNITRFGLILWGRLSGVLEEQKTGNPSQEEKIARALIHALEIKDVATQEDALQRVSSDPSFFWKLDPKWQEDPIVLEKATEKVLNLLSTHPFYLHFLDTRWLKNETVLSLVLDNITNSAEGFLLLEEASLKDPALWKVFKEKIHDFLLLHPTAFKTLPKKLQSNQEIQDVFSKAKQAALRHMDKNPLPFLYRENEWLDDPDVLQIARHKSIDKLKECPLVFKALTESLRQDKEVIQAMKELVLNHYKSTQERLLWIPEEIWEDPAIIEASLPAVIACISKCPNNFSDLPQFLQSRQEVLEAAKAGAETLPFYMLYDLPKELTQHIAPPNTQNTLSWKDSCLSSLESFLANNYWKSIAKEPFLLDSLKKMLTASLLHGSTHYFCEPFLANEYFQNVLEDPTIKSAAQEMLLSGLSYSWSGLQETWLDDKAVFNAVKSLAITRLTDSPEFFDKLTQSLQKDPEIIEAAILGCLDELKEKAFFRPLENTIKFSKILPFLLEDPRTPPLFKEKVLQAIACSNNLSKLKKASEFPGQKPEIVSAMKARICALQQDSKDRIRYEAPTNTLYTWSREGQWSDSASKTTYLRDSLEDEEIFNLVKNSILSRISEILNHNGGFLESVAQVIGKPKPLAGMEFIDFNFPAKLRDDPEIIEACAKLVSLDLERVIFRQDPFWSNLLKNQELFSAAQKLALKKVSANPSDFALLDTALQEDPFVRETAKKTALAQVADNPLFFSALPFQLQKEIAEEALEKNPYLLESCQDTYAVQVFSEIAKKKASTPEGMQKGRNAVLSMISKDPKSFMSLSHSCKNNPLFWQTATKASVRRVSEDPFLFETLSPQIQSAIADEAFTQNPWLLMYCENPYTLETFKQLAEHKRALEGAEQKGEAIFRKHLSSPNLNKFLPIVLSSKNFSKDRVETALQNPQLMDNLLQFLLETPSFFERLPEKIRDLVKYKALQNNPNLPDFCLKARIRNDLLEIQKKQRSWWPF